MPSFWQITQARGLQTQGVWALSGGFTVGNHTAATHATSIGDLFTAATEAEDKENLLDTEVGVLEGEYAHFKSMNTAIAARLDGEVDDGDPLQRDIDQLRIVSDSRSAIEDRTLKTAAAWGKIDTARAAASPALPAVTVRGSTQAVYLARWVALPGKRQNRELAEGVLRSASSALRAADRVTDRINKDWYLAWKSEFPAGTPEGDALAGVDTEQGGSMPQVLEISAIVQEGLSLRVTYVPGTGAHATVLDLNYLVEGINADFQRLTADSAAGNLIGPFTAGQIVRVRTDVGNSRDHSELSAEQAVTIAPAP